MQQKAFTWTHLGWINEQKALARTLGTLLSDVHAFYVSSGTGPNAIAEDCLNSFKEFERKRSATVQATRKVLASFKNDIKVLKGKHELASSGKDVDPMAIKDLLEGFESKLTSYKSAMRRDFDALISDFGATEEELKLCLEKSSIKGDGSGVSSGDDSMDSDPSATTSKMKNTRQDLDKNLHMQTQVGMVDRQIQELGGRSGRWDPRDHDVFMRVWNQTPASRNASDDVLQLPKKRMLCRKLVTLLSDKTDVDCEEHYDWYVQYNELLEKKKKLLEEWKGMTLSEKEKERRAILAGETAASRGSGSPSRGVRQQPSAPARDEAEMQRMREQIERWKQQKADETEAQVKAKREEDLRERQLRAERARKRQQEARLHLDKWKADEAVIKQMENLNVQGGSSPRRKGSAPTAAEIELNAHRDLEIAKRRREERETKEKKASSRESRLKDLEGKITSAPSASRDPSRVMADTIATGLGRKTAEQLDLAERRRASSGAHSAPLAMSGRDLSTGGMRRAIPSWTRHQG